MEAAMEREGVGGGKRQFCTFRISGRRFGVDILDVKEINSEVHFTPVFHAPPEVRGYVNIRGEVYLVLDLALILRFESREVDDSSRIVLFDPEAGESFGVLVDSIGDIVTINDEDIENRRGEDQGPPEEGTERRKLDLGDGVCKLEEELLVLVKSKHMLSIIKKLCERGVAG